MIKAYDQNGLNSSLMISLENLDRESQSVPLPYLNKYHCGVVEQGTYLLNPQLLMWSCIRLAVLGLLLSVNVKQGSAQTKHTCSRKPYHNK